MRPHTCCQILFGISMHCFDDKRKGSLQQQKQICPSENEVNVNYFSLHQCISTHRPRETEIHPDGIGEGAIR